MATSRRKTNQIDTKPIFFTIWVTHLVFLQFRQQIVPVNQSINQSINQLINQSANHSINLTQTCNNGVRWNVLGHHGACAHYTAVPNDHNWQNHSTSSNPTIRPNRYWLGVLQNAASSGLNRMGSSVNAEIWAEKTPRSYPHRHIIKNGTIKVEIGRCAQVDVWPVVAFEWRLDPHAFPWKKINHVTVSYLKFILLPFTQFYYSKTIFCIFQNYLSTKEKSYYIQMFFYYYSNLLFKNSIAKSTILPSTRSKFNQNAITDCYESESFERSSQSNKRCFWDIHSDRPETLDTNTMS